MASSYYKWAIFVCVVIASVTVAAEAQLIGPISGLLRIGGTLYCTANGNIGNNGIATAVFPNATVQVQCGSGNNVVVAASGLTNGGGVFSIIVEENPLLQMLLSTLVTSCRLVVTTPLATCNAALPSVGVLTSTLQTLTTNLLFGILNITTLAPVGFLFTP